MSWDYCFQYPFSVDFVVALVSLERWFMGLWSVVSEGWIVTKGLDICRVFSLFLLVEIVDSNKCELGYGGGG